MQCCRIALAAGKHVVVEKPLALCAADVEALTREARERGLLLHEGMWTRCFPAVRKARELLAAGAIWPDPNPNPNTLTLTLTP